jgi:hypothetical protein
VLSWYVAQVQSEWFWNGSCHPSYYWFIIIIIIIIIITTTSCWRSCSTTQQFSFSLLWGTKCQNVTLKGQSHFWFCWTSHKTHTRNCLSYTFIRKVTLAVWTNDLLHLQSTGLQGLKVTYNKKGTPLKTLLLFLLEFPNYATVGGLPDVTTQQLYLSLPLILKMLH